MSGKFIDLLYNIAIQLRWKYLILLFLVSFFGGWAATSYFEPTADIVSPKVYWWYFLKTVLGGGYSGYSPETIGSRVVSLLSSFCGGLFFIATLCKSTVIVHENLQKKKKGLVQLKMKDHIVLLGYRPGETGQLISQLRADHLVETPIVLASKHLTENPFPGKVEFVFGDTASDDVMARSRVDQARVIVISGHADERALAVAIAANSYARKDVHIVAYLDNFTNAKLLRKLNPQIECVTSLRAPLLAQAVINPGASMIFKELVSLDDPGTAFRIDVPSSVLPIPFSQVLAILHHEYRAIVIGFTENHSCESKYVLNPQADAIIVGGMSLFYIAEHRIDRQVDWRILDPIPVEGEIQAAVA